VYTNIFDSEAATMTIGDAENPAKQRYEKVGEITCIYCRGKTVEGG
jgi:hypothetical protein